MKQRKQPITATEARRNLHALDVLSGRTTEPPKPRAKPIQHEAQIQRQLFSWAAQNAVRYPELRLLFHVPNEGKRSVISGYNLKIAGLKVGVPDLCLPVARSGYHGLYIELKSENGRLQDHQRQWIDDLNKQGYKAVTAYGFDEARTAIEDYLNSKFERGC